MQGALKAIQEIFHNKKPNYVFGLENVKVNDYDIIMTSWREWLISGKMSKVEYAHRELLKKCLTSTLELKITLYVFKVIIYAKHY